MTAERHAKQVIVVRKDLRMGKGKLVAQGSHASLGAVLMIQSKMKLAAPRIHELIGPYNSWIEGIFTKVCLAVESEEELLELERAAESAGLPVKLITDSGLTEFHGVPTRTCLAIGPSWSEDIDKITGKLKLL